MPNYSYTRLRTLEECGRKYELQYVEKRRSPKDQTTYFVGRVVHDTIHRWTQAGYPDVATMRAFVRESLAAERETLVRVGKAKSDDFIRQVVTAAVQTASIYRRLSFKEHGALIEHRFSIAFPGLPDSRFNGAVDVYDPVTHWIYDLKCYSSTSGSADPEQLLTYAIAEQALGNPVEGAAFIYPLRRFPVKPITLTPELLDARRQHQIDLLAKGNPPFQAEPGEHCRWCGWYSTRHCPATQTQAAAEMIRRYEEAADGPLSLQSTGAATASA